MKILNVDQYASATRQISFGGKVYPVEEPSVQQFIDNLKAAEGLEGADAEKKPESLANSFEQAVKAISQAIPTMSEVTIRGLKLVAITAILQFIRGELDEDIANSEETDGSEKKQS